MKKQLLLLSIFISAITLSSAQVLCVQCYYQNDTVYAGGTNLIQNGGFENNNCIPENWFASSYCPNSSYYNCNIANWTCTGGGPSTYADIVDIGYTAIIQGSLAVYLGNHYCSACNATLGDTSCINNTFCSVTGIPVGSGYPISESGYGGATGLSLSQTVSGLTPGGNYVLEFWAGGESQTERGVFALDVGFGNIMLGNRPTPSPSGVGIRFLVTFVASSTSHTIKFTNWGHVNSSGTELILDDVKLYQWGSVNPPCNGEVGISELNENNITVYPNPSEGKFTLESTLVIGNSLLVNVYNVLGEIVYQSSTKQLNNLKIDLSNEADGIYFVEIKTGDRTVRKKLIKE